MYTDTQIKSIFRKAITPKVNERLLANCEDINDRSNNPSQSQHILHAVETGLLLGQPLGGANSAAGEGVAAVGAVNEFKSLADAAEDNRVLADDVTSADRKERNFFLGPFTDDAFAAVDADFVQIAIQRCRNRSA